ncbi:2934_t:CDS:2, partial [Racocetra fulgida]
EDIGVSNLKQLVDPTQDEAVEQCSQKNFGTNYGKKDIYLAENDQSRNSTDSRHKKLLTLDGMDIVHQEASLYNKKMQESSGQKVSEEKLEDNYCDC